MKIAVFGATGRTGRHVLEQGIRRGHLITAFTRRPQELTSVQELHAVVHGDGHNLSVVRDAVRGQDCIISILSSPGLGPSTTISEVTKNIITAMGETGVRRLICVSSHSLVAARPWLVVKLVKWIFRNPYADLGCYGAGNGHQSSGLDDCSCNAIDRWAGYRADSDRTRWVRL